MTLAFSRFIVGDDDPLAAGRGHPVRDVALIRGSGGCPRRWSGTGSPRSAAPGGSSAAAAAFAGTLATRIRLARRGTRSSRGMVERTQRVLRDLVPARPHVRLPARLQRPARGLADRRANTRTVRADPGPARSTCWTADLAGDDRAAAGGARGRADQPGPAGPRLLRARRHQRLLRRPAGDRPVRRRHRLPRPGSSVSCDGQVVPATTAAGPARVTITDPAHVATARAMRAALAAHARRTSTPRARPSPPARRRPRRRASRALPDYDALFGVDFDPTPPSDHASRAAAAAQRPHDARTTTAHQRPAAAQVAIWSMLAYLTRVLKTPTIGRVLGRPRRPGPRRELVARGVPGRGAATPGRRPRVRRHHDADPHRALPGQSRPSRTSTSTTCPRCAGTCSPTWPPARSSPRPRT